jgi:hypothetical protein
MEKHQVEGTDQPWRGDRDEPDVSRADRTGRERITNRELADRKRAEYLRLHDDDEAELELPR